MYELFPTPGTFVWKNLVFLETIPPLSANYTKPAYPIRLFLCIPTNRKNFQKSLDFSCIVWYTVSVERERRRHNTGTAHGARLSDSSPRSLKTE